MVKGPGYIITLCLFTALILLSSFSISTAFAYEKQKASGKLIEPIVLNSKAVFLTDFIISEADEFEEDNNYTQAKWIFTNSTPQTRTFDPIGESDWAKFNATAGLTYLIETQNLTNSTDTYLRLFSTDGTSLLGYNDDINYTSGNRNSRIRWFCKENGNYYIQVLESPAAAFSVGGVYNLTVSNITYAPGVHGGDAYEPDNMFLLANNTTIGTYPNQTPYFHTYDYFTNDEDYRVFNATQGTVYVIQTFNTSMSPFDSSYPADTFIQLYRSDGTTFVKSNDDINSVFNPVNYNSRIIFKANETAHYYVNSWDLQTASGNYSIDIYSPEMPWLYTNGTSEAKSFNLTGGVELFRFNATEGEMYEIKTANTTSATDTWMFLYDENMTLLRENDDTYAESTYSSKIVWYASENQTCYIAVSDSYRKGGSFTVRVNTTTTEGGDTYEQDGSMSAAKWIYTNKTVQNHSFYPVGEEDWIKFNASAGTVYVIETSNTTSYTDTLIKLYYENGTLITYHDDKSYPNDRNSIIEFNATQAGTFYVQILDVFNYGGNYSVYISEKSQSDVTLTFPDSETNVTKGATFRVTAKVSCNSANCGDITLILDPEKQKTEKSKPSESGSDSETEYSEAGTYIVMLKDGLSLSSLETLQQKKYRIHETQDSFLSSLSEEVVVLTRYKTINALVLNLTSSQVEELKKSSMVSFIQEPREYSLLLNQSIPLVRANHTWNVLDENSLNITGQGQTVCVIDTGVNYSHPSLAHAYRAGYDFYYNDSDAMDGHGHGTHVTGIIVSNDTTNTGIAPDAGFVAMKIFSDSGGSTTSDLVISAIDWCTEHAEDYNITVISMSIGDSSSYSTISSCEAVDSSLVSAVNTAAAEGIILVAASGNNGHTSGISFPACIENIISVGSVDDGSDGTTEDVISSFTNSGSLLDLLAPGQKITSTGKTGFVTSQGTSQATPHVSGAVLLMNQLYLSKTNHTLTKDKALYYLESKGTLITQESRGTFPRIDIYSTIIFMNNSKGGVIPMNHGFPFYTTSQNPRYPENLTCLQNMKEGDTCEVTWIVNATGELSTTWEFFVEIESNLFGVLNANNSNKINLTISSEDQAPQINVNYPGNEMDLNATDILLNITSSSDTSMLALVQARFQNSTWNSSWVNLTNTEHTDIWTYLFSTQSFEEGEYTINFSAQNSAGTSNFTHINITLDNKFPVIEIISEFPQYAKTPWLNYTIDDTSANATWYMLNNGTHVTTNDTGADSVNATLNLVYPGWQEIVVYANDSVGNTNSTMFRFYESFFINMSNWTTNANLSIPESVSVKVFNSTDISSYEEAGIEDTFNLTIESENFNSTLVNFPGQNASWAAKQLFNITENIGNLQTIFQSQGSNISKSVSFYNMSAFISESLYTASTAFTGNFTGIYYCETENIESFSDCTEITATCAAYSGTACYNSTPSLTTVYAPRFSTFAVENDTTAPEIEIVSPRNTSAYTLNSETYNLTVNATVSGDTSSCQMSVNGASNSTMSKQGTTNFIGYTVQNNGFHNVTLYCTDGTNLNSSERHFTINDTTGPSVSKTVSVSTTSATVSVTPDEPFYGVVYYSTSSSTITSVGSQYCKEWTNKSSSESIADRWDDNFDGSVVILNTLKTTAHSFSVTGLSTSQNYYYGICTCDYFDNCADSSSFSFTTEDSESNDSSSPSAAPTTAPASNATVPAVKKVTSIWGDIPANTETTWTISSSGIPVNKIVFKLSESLNGFKLDLTSMGSSSSATGLVSAPNNVYDYFKMESSVLDKVNSAEFSFKIPKSWFTTNRYDPEKVRMYRYEITASGKGEWRALFTTAVDTQGTEYRYKSISPGFSFFAITAASLPPELIPDAALGEAFATNDGETIVETEQKNLTCGDGVCSEDETCVTCPADCGECRIFGITFLSNAVEFVKMYWIPFTISGAVVISSLVFVVVINRRKIFSGKKNSWYNSIADKFSFALPSKIKVKSSGKSSPKSTTFELGINPKKTKQTILSKEASKKEAPKKTFKIFNTVNKKRPDVEEIKKHPGQFKLK